MRLYAQLFKTHSFLLSIFKALWRFFLLMCVSFSRIDIYFVLFLCLFFYIYSFIEAHIPIEVFIHPFTREQLNELTCLSLSLVHFSFSLQHDELFYHHRNLCLVRSLSLQIMIEREREKKLVISSS